MKKILALILTAALLLCCFAGCSAANKDPVSDKQTDTAASPKDTADVQTEPEQTDTAADSDLAYIKDKGVLIVGVTDFAPMDYQDANGEWIGFDADLAKAFAESLGVEVKFVEIEWDYKILELENKSIDCVWNGMTLGDEVLAAMECTVPYCNNSQVVVVNAADAAQYQTADACMDLRFAVEAGSAGEDMAEELGFIYTPVVDQATALMEVAAGTANAAIIDKLMAAAMVGEGTDYENLTYTVDLNEEVYGVGFRKGSDMAAALNDFFAAVIADGTMRQLAELYGVQASLIE